MRMGGEVPLRPFHRANLEEVGSVEGEAGGARKLLCARPAERIFRCREATGMSREFLGSTTQEPASSVPHLLGYRNERARREEGRMGMIVMPVVGVLYTLGVVAFVVGFQSWIEGLKEWQQVLLFFGILGGFPAVGAVAAYIVAIIENPLTPARG
ncbi:hypothetical protein HY573_02025 [Candidatus Parcubacteria bacterium]|nr:hypothetical protein [Candidatus Parcubacteria bacterium]